MLAAAAPDSIFLSSSPWMISFLERRWAKSFRIFSRSERIFPHPLMGFLNQPSNLFINPAALTAEFGFSSFSVCKMEHKSYP
jgi:hypothetical protein